MAQADTASGEFANTPSTAQPTAHAHIELPFLPPFDWPRMLRFYRSRSSAGVETVENDTYIRTLEWQGEQGLLNVRPHPRRMCLIATLQGPAGRHLPALRATLARMFDLDADPARIQQGLSQDPWLRRLLVQAPGLRIPGCWSAFELVVRTIVGQQVSVKAATTITGRLVQRAGRPTTGPGHALAAWQFPTPAALAAADLSHIGMPGKRVAALQHLAAEVASGVLILERDFSHDDGPGQLRALRQALLALPGIGPWTVEYTAMRAWRDADAWPATDLVLMQAVAREHPSLPKAALQHAHTQQWRPWRAYAAMHLWNELADLAGAPRGG